VTKQDTSENQVKNIYLGIGSNLGNKINNIEKAKFLLMLNGFNIAKTSSYYETFSWPDANMPKFLNIVVLIRTNFSPEKLLVTLKKIEIQLGRKKNIKNSPRECDIDIIDYQNKIITKDITLPHQRMHKRNFVLFPLYEIDKKWTHPISKISIKKLIFSLPIKDIRSIKQI
jgi:2-amino-4-hydroxy-6-hydroxymethyldihydropteridine diphosphokinase